MARGVAWGHPRPVGARELELTGSGRSGPWPDFEVRQTLVAAAAALATFPAATAGEADARLGDDPILYHVVNVLCWVDRVCPLDLEDSEANVEDLEKNANEGEGLYPSQGTAFPRPDKEKDVICHPSRPSSAGSEWVGECKM